MIERGCGAAPDALECHVFDQPLCNAHVGKSVHLIQDNLVAGGVKRMQSALRQKRLHTCKLQKQRRRKAVKGAGVARRRGTATCSA